jgi:NAD(P)-dependent dehydrogenase (short-subunit alcohol dehydrogenase family)
MPELDGMVALVTGAGSGIGLATARHLTAAGAAVAGVDLDPSAIEPPIYPVIADVTDDRSVRDAVRMVVDHFGRLDILVNNAGIGARGTVEENPDDEWRRVFEVNVLGIVRLTRAALPHLRQSPAPAVVNTCSVAATKGIQNRTIYSASKGAVQSLTLAMAADHLHEGIRINCVNPGTADTPWVQRLLDAAEDPVAERRALEARQPIGRLISADEIAAAITVLAGPLASGITGTVLAGDGGMHSLAVRPKAD